jgi:hypothetical protein
MSNFYDYLPLILFFVAWLLAVSEALYLNRKLSISKANESQYRQGFQEANNRAFDLKTQLDEAQKQLCDLRGQTPGRDKTGRFVKREEKSVCKR